MAFDIQRTQRSLPGRGRGVGFQADLSTGQAQIAGAVGQVGGAVTNTAVVLNRLQAENQLSEAKRQHQEILQQFQDAIEREPDSSLYPEIAKQAQQAMSEVAPKNRLANRAYGMLLNQTKAGMAGTILNVSLERERDTKRADVALMMTKGQFKRARKAVRKGVKDGTFTKVQAERLIAGSLVEEKKFINNQQFVAGQRFAMRDPDTFLGFVEGDKIVGLGLDTLTPGQVQALRATAEGTANFNERRAEEDNAAMLDEIFKAAATATPQEMHATLAQADIDPKEKVRLFSVFSSMQAKIKDGGPNPFTSTQDYEALMNGMIDIQKGKKMTNRDLQRIMLPPGTTEPRFSFNHLLMLENMLAARDKTGDDNTQFRPTHPAAQSIFADHLHSYGVEDIAEISPDERAEYIQERIVFEDIMRKNWDNPALMGKLAETMQEKVNQQKTQGLMKRLITGLFIPPFFTIKGILKDSKSKPEELKLAQNNDTGERAISFDGGQTWQRIR
jgi:hypothetical protein